MTEAELLLATLQQRVQRLIIAQGSERELLAVHVVLQNAVLRSSEAHIRASNMLRPCRRLTPHHARTFCKCRGLDGDHHASEGVRVGKAAREAKERLAGVAGG